MHGMAQYTPEEVMTEMPQAGVPTVIVQNIRDIVDFDPQRRARELFLRMRYLVGDYLHAR
jgi:crotonobetainyl-CoA:carnitine CoA-transferase CaiB-like acyl-CoA transferase